MTREPREVVFDATPEWFPVIGFLAIIYPVVAP